MSILITGVAGFIGMHLANSLLKDSQIVYGIDNLNDYYDVELKTARIKQLEHFGKNFKFFKLDIIDKKKLVRVFNNYDFEIVIHLAAQAGVRYSLYNPDVYVKSNIEGFLNILQNCKDKKIKHLIYASSSSVYGSSSKLSFLETDNTSNPLSIYGATKKSNEVMAYSYSHLYNLPTTGLRFFTVYGPWGRPDMALFIFTASILSKKTINVFNNGKITRDFTYIDDVVNVIKKVSTKPPSVKKNKKKLEQKTPYQLFNVGNSNPVQLLNYIKTLEETLGIKAKKNFLPLPITDVLRTSSNCKSLEKFIGYKPKTSIKQGITNFIKWYKFFYKIK